MATKLETIVLADLLNDVRSITKRNLSLLSDVEPRRDYEAFGTRFHSVYWIASHLTWSEHFLLIEGVSGTTINIPWLNKFTIGGDFDPSGEIPDYEEVLLTMERVHEEAQTMLRSLPLETLDELNHLGFGFGGDMSKRKLIYHSIRHEPMHSGQLSWICKINGIETV